MTGAEPASTDVRPPGQGPRLRFLVIGVVLAVGLGIGLFTSLGAPRSSVPAVGAAAPPFTLGALGASGTVGVPQDGGGGGRPVVLIFFASWCGPCHAEMPALARAYRRQSDPRVQLVGIDGMDPTGPALRFVHQSGVTFPVGVDATYRVTEGLFAFNGDPDAVFIDGRGTIQRIVHGPITAAQLAADERALR